MLAPDRRETQRKQSGIRQMQEVVRQAGWQAGRLVGRKTERHAGRQIGRQEGRQAGRPGGMAAHRLDMSHDFDGLRMVVVDHFSTT